MPNEEKRLNQPKGNRINSVKTPNTNKRSKEIIS